MAEYNLSRVFDFLEAMETNNNREWFNLHREVYDKAKAVFDLFVEQVGRGIEQFDAEFKYTNPKFYTYRIYRDVRFSKNKLPYKNHFGAYFCNGGRKSPLAGYFLKIQKGESVVGGGIYRPEREMLKAIRQEVYYSFKELDNIINEKKFKSFYPKLIEDKLKRGPKNYAKECDAIEYLKYKSYAVAHPFADREVLGANFQNQVLDSFELLKPLTEYLNKAIAFAQEEDSYV